MTRTFAPLLMGLAIAVSAPAWAAVTTAHRTFDVTADYHSPNEASFTSKAAIVRFTGRTSQVTGTLQFDPNDVAHGSGSVAVDLASLDTGIGMRNEHMRRTIEADKYPTATFKVTKVHVPGNSLKANTPITGSVTGLMTLHGVTRTVQAPVDLTFLPQQDAKYRPGDWIAFSTDFKLKLSDYQITLPAPVLGIKVADDLDISFNSMAKAK
jgi:polyisoprenoid-binding protein YceI